MIRRNKRILMKKYKRCEQEQTEYSYDTKAYKDYQAKMNKLDDKAERLRYRLFGLGVVE